MSKSTAKSGNEIGEYKQYENEINDIFTKHYEDIKKKYQKLIKKLDDWGAQYIKQITDHVEEQKRLLTEIYDDQKRALDKQFQEDLSTVETYHAAQSEDLLNELLNACRALKFKLARLTSSRWEIERQEVTAEMTPMEKKQSETAARLSAARSRRRQGQDGSKKAEDTSGPSQPAPSETATSSTEQIDDRPSSTTKSKREQSPKGGSTDQCPLCFMIFPASMTARARQEHVNEHME